jgi:hypothetical protein
LITSITPNEEGPLSRLAVVPDADNQDEPKLVVLFRVAATAPDETHEAFVLETLDAPDPPPNRRGMVLTDPTERQTVRELALRGVRPAQANFNQRVVALVRRLVSQHLEESART